jgi:hypothetical protein
MGDDSTPPNSH